jgi:F1F0 ATPase subunit 2
MKMADYINVIFPFVFGILLGGIFYGGLWFTVQRGTRSQKPWLWFLLSPILRMGIVLAGFYLVAGGEWQRILICLAGFIVARLLVTLLTGREQRAGDAS